jgi:outer membrane lipoprotein-sorting protein
MRHEKGCKIARTAFFPALLWLVLIPILATGEEISPGQLFKQVESRFASLNSLSYTVKRTVTSRKQHAEDQWLFRYRQPDSVRIDYLLPHERTIIIDKNTLVEYIPVSVDGLHLGSYEEMEKRAVRVQPVQWAGMDAYRVEGADPRYLVYIDKGKKALLRTEIYDKKGKLTIRTEASKFVEVAKDFWFPQAVRINYASESGPVQSTLLLQDIKVGDIISDDVFHLSFPKGVEIILN